MDFIHYPQSFSTIAEHFKPTGIDIEYYVICDEDAEDPRKDFTTSEVALYSYKGSGDEDVPENLIAQAFDRFYSHFDDDDKALAATHRWLAIFHPEITKQVSLAIAPIAGYTQNQWANVFCVAKNGYGTPEEHIDTYRQWVYGDVWTVWSQSEDPDVPNETLHGIYADTAQEAVEIFIDNCPPPVSALTFTNPVLQALVPVLLRHDSDRSVLWMHANQDEVGSQLNALIFNIIIQASQ